MNVTFHTESKITVDFSQADADIPAVDAANGNKADYFDFEAMGSLPGGLFVSIADGPIDLVLKSKNHEFTIKFTYTNWFDDRPCDMGCNHFQSEIPDDFYPGSKVVGMNATMDEDTPLSALITSFHFYRAALCSQISPESPTLPSDASASSDDG